MGGYLPAVGAQQAHRQRGIVGVGVVGLLGGDANVWRVPGVLGCRSGCRCLGGKSATSAAWLIRCCMAWRTYSWRKMGPVCWCGVVQGDGPRHHPRWATAWTEYPSAVTRVSWAASSKGDVAVTDPAGRQQGVELGAVTGETDHPSSRHRTGDRTRVTGIADIGCIPGRGCIRSAASRGRRSPATAGCWRRSASPCSARAGIHRPPWRPAGGEVIVAHRPAVRVLSQDVLRQRDELGQLVVQPARRIAGGQKSGRTGGPEDLQ